MRFTSAAPIGMVAQGYLLASRLFVRDKKTVQPIIPQKIDAEVSPIPDDVIIDQIFVMCGEDSDVVLSLRTAVAIEPESTYYIKETLQAASDEILRILEGP